MEADKIARLLPEIYQDARLRGRAAEAEGAPGSVLDALLDVMAAHHAPVETVLADFDAYFDPRRAKEPFVKLLASWMSLAPYLSLQNRGGAEAAGSVQGGSGRGLSGTPLRELTARAAELARLRGTADGLRIFLETATGIDGFAVTERPGGFSATVTVPVAARPLDGLIRLIVAREKPAFTTIEIEHADATDSTAA